MSPIAAVGLSKAVEPAVTAASNLLNPSSPAHAALPGFAKELLHETGRSEEIAVPVDHELLALCNEARQKDFGTAILGHTVQVCDTKGQVLSGRVDKVWMENNVLNFAAAGQNFTLHDLRAVYQPQRPTSLRGITPKDGSMK